MNNEIRYEREDLTAVKEGNVVTLTVGGHSKVNALGVDACRAVDKILDEIEADKEIRCLVITGGGEKSFIAGADIKDLAKYTPADAYEHIEVGHKLFTRIENLSIPTIAMINGYCLGGGLEIAMSCDIRISSERAKFGQPEIGIGMIPGWGATARLPKLVGMSVAKYLCMTGEFITSKQAVDFGLVFKTYETVEELREEGMKLAQKLAAYPAKTMSATKRMLNDSFSKRPEEVADRDALGLAYMFTTHDSLEGLNAFIEKRKPEFTGE